MNQALKAYQLQEAAAATSERAFADLYHRIMNWTDSAGVFYEMGLRRQGDLLMDKSIAALCAMELVLAKGETAPAPSDREIASRCRILTRAVLEQCNRARNSAKAEDFAGMGARLRDLSQIFFAMDEVNLAGCR